MIRLTFAFNAIHLEAARRLRTSALPQGSDRTTTASRGPMLDLLIIEHRRCKLTTADHQLWPLRWPVCPPVMAALALLGWLGLVGEVRLAHLRNAGRALRQLVRRGPRLVLLDDGLDQYRAAPLVIDPAAFPPSTPLALFTDCPADRAPWCDRFEVLELGPLYPPAPGHCVRSQEPAAADSAEGTLIVDSPGVDRLMAVSHRLPQPWSLLPHPVRFKRSWTLPAAPAANGPSRPGVEERMASFPGLIVVGESMAMLAALRSRRLGAQLLIALPAGCDHNLRRLAERAAASDAAVECFPFIAD